MNRNGWQQLKAGWLGGQGYDGGHVGPSALGFIGERTGLFPQHEWQNRLRGEANDADANNYFNSEKAVIDRVKRALTRGEPVDLSWDMELLPGANPGVPSGLEPGYKGSSFV